CFFFQAEDGIRDFHVTGVQTCALPIYRTRTPSIKARGYAEVKFIDIHGLAGGLSLGATQAGWTMTHRAGLDFGSPALEANRDHRSEERRVGKECRYAWRAYHEKMTGAR